MIGTLGVLISGRGSNLKAIIDAITRGDLDASIAIVISNRADAPGLDHARQAGIETLVLSHKPYPTREDYDRALVAELRQRGVELVCLAGFMRLLSPVFVDAYPNRILNIHPSLLPKYPGLHPQQQALDDGARESGATVHFVNKDLDAGPIVLQREVPVLPGDTERALADRILQVEHTLYPEAIAAVLDRGETMIYRALLLAIVSAVTLYGQAPQADTFKFRDGRSQTLSVMLDDANATIATTWPDAAAGGWDTALLGVDVNVATDGPAPFVEITSAGRSDRQYFLPGETGPRWLNLSFLRGTTTGGARVSLRTEGVRLAPGPAPLRLFVNNLDLSRTLLVLAPHPDDAEIAAFGMYAYRNATVVTVTTGNAGPRNYEAVFDDVAAMYRFKGRIRLIDSITVPWQGGIPPARTFNMGYFDARLAEMHDQPTAVIPEMYGPNTDIGVYLSDNIGSLLPKRTRASKWTNLVDDLEAVLKKVKPAIIVAPHPQLDAHADHQFATVALAEALSRRRTRAALLLYTNHADRNRYPYGPAGTLVSLPPPIEQEVQIDRVYSHPVSIDLQRQKLFALESMHDLRSSPSRLYQVEIGADRSIEPEEVGPSAAGGVNYLRRGPRSNELFFVYDETTLKPTIDAFLAAWRARPPR